VVEEIEERHHNVAVGSLKGARGDARQRPEEQRVRVVEQLLCTQHSGVVTSRVPRAPLNRMSQVTHTSRYKYVYFTWQAYTHVVSPQQYTSSITAARTSPDPPSSDKSSSSGHHAGRLTVSSSPGSSSMYAAYCELVPRRRSARMARASAKSCLSVLRDGRRSRAAALMPCSRHACEFNRSVRY